MIHVRVGQKNRIYRGGRKRKRFTVFSFVIFSLKNTAINKYATRSALQKIA